MDPLKTANQIKINTVIRNMAKRGIWGYHCETQAEAEEMILDMIEDRSVISWGGSQTINTLGIKARLAKRDVTLIDPYGTNDPEEQLERRRQGLLADYYLMSSNAVTMDGELINIDGTSNRVAALCFGPKMVIVVAGVNKLALDLGAALNRAKQSAAVPNNIRLKRKSPCTITGICIDCLSKDFSCCNIVTTRFCNTPGRLRVILVNECLGY